MLYIFGRDPISAPLLPISFHLKVSSFSFHLGVLSDSMILRFWGVPFHFSSRGFIPLCHLNSGYSSNDKELLEEIVANDQIAMQMIIICVNIWEHFTLTKPNEKNGQSVNPNVNVGDILTTMQATPSLFKFFTNFMLGEFEESMQLVITTIINHAT
jgi:hypothetical protein